MVLLLVLVCVGVLTLVLVRLIVASGHRGGGRRVLAGRKVGLPRVTSGVYHGRHMYLVLIWERVSALGPSASSAHMLQDPSPRASRAGCHGSPQQRNVEVVPPCVVAVRVYCS